MGRTVIDSLVLELGFDTQGMDQGRRRVEDTFKKTKEGATNTGKAIDDATKKSGQYLEKLRNNVLALFGVFTADKGLKNFVADVTSSDAALGRFAKTIGETTKTLASWRATGSIFGVDPSEIDKSFAAYNQQLQDFKLSGQANSLTQTAVALKLNLVGGDGKPIEAGKFFDTVRTKLNSMGLDDATKANIYGRLGASSGLIQILESTDDVYKKLRADSEALAAAQAADAGPAAERLIAWSNFKTQLQVVGTVALTALTPALVAVSHGLTAIALFFQANPTLGTVVFTALAAALGVISIALTALAFSGSWAALVGAIGAVGGAVKVLGITSLRGMFVNLMTTLGALTETFLPALADAFIAVGIAIETTPVGWILTALAAIGAAAYAIYDHWSTIKGWWHDLFGGMADDTQHAADKIDGAKKKMSQTPISVAGGGANANSTAWQAALDTQQKYGIPATVSYAQYQLESANGKRMPAGSNNPFGIKATNAQVAAGQYVEAMTWEHRNGKDVHEMAKFAKYDSIADAFEAHAKLLATSKYYAKARAVENDPNKFADALTGIYASDPQYGAKLKKLMAQDQAATPGADTKAALSQAVTGAPVPVTITNGQQAAVSNNSSASSTSTSTSETNIQEMHVHSAATNAAPMAGDIRDALSRDNFVNQSNSGPT